MAEIILNVDVRENTGTGGARAARRAGAVPGILYGGDKAPVAISVNEKDFRKNLYTGKLLGHLVTLKYGDETQPVIAKDVQFDPVSDRPLHFDLMRVDENADHQDRSAGPLHQRRPVQGLPSGRLAGDRPSLGRDPGPAPTTSPKTWSSTWPATSWATPSAGRT